MTGQVALGDGANGGSGCGGIRPDTRCEMKRRKSFHAKREREREKMRKSIICDESVLGNTIREYLPINIRI